ncbi:MAG: DUF2243 domain-containing protein [Alicyclobacillus sp.]|nr:DUF2243 domain-containing protein [Alicyclobacillus sp.]
MRSLLQNGTFFGAFFFGMGLIGMLDGIHFHQLLQWRSMYMYTSRFYQVVSDGWLHFFCTTLWVVGTITLSKADRNQPRSQRLFASGFFLGAGVFNLAEGLIDHHILGIHHVKFGDPHEFAYDVVFDLVAIVLLVIGWMSRPTTVDGDRRRHI